ncbi:MAG: hypothetical protein L6V81_04880 [Clostridium sp.]|nr:MAG: hypothetical protein L6V81_04880 [Clostridium sp.]
MPDESKKLEEIEILVILNMTNLKIIMMDSLINVVVILEKDGRYYEGGYGKKY